MFSRFLKLLAVFIFLTIITVVSIFPRKALVLSLIAGGLAVSPEGSAILCHYCFGKGDTLYLSPSYISRSPVVIKSKEGMKTGEVRKVTFRQKDDWRLSYALNPFHIKKETNGYVIYQYIEFSRSAKIYTELNLGIIKIRVPDNIVHTFNCKPFTAVCRITS